MLIGILKEIKTEENRVCMTPAGVEVMMVNGHSVSAISAPKPPVKFLRDLTW